LIQPATLLSNRRIYKRQQTQLTGNNHHNTTQEQFTHTTIVTETTTHFPPRKMTSTSNPIYFVHIGKAGGTSIDTLMYNLKNRSKLHNKQLIGKAHYDWSHIELKEQRRLNERMKLNNNATEEVLDVPSTADVMTILRNPVSRSVSQFYFSKDLEWATKSNSSFVHQTIDEYIDDTNKTWFQPLSDGEGGVDFLAGIFSSDRKCWVKSDWIETDLKVYLRRNKTAACLRAAQRLEQTVWFGIVEDLQRSMRLLQYTLDLERTPVLPKRNRAKKEHLPPSSETVAKLERYLQKDMWLYEYSKRLFEARWKYFMGDGVYVHPELPPLPDFDSPLQDV
jgi:hypothetical protein